MKNINKKSQGKVIKLKNDISPKIELLQSYIHIACTAKKIKLFGEKNLKTFFKNLSEHQPESPWN